jgi:hypothetical protein
MREFFCSIGNDIIVISKILHVKPIHNDGIVKIIFDTANNNETIISGDVDDIMQRIKHGITKYHETILNSANREYAIGYSI